MPKNSENQRNGWLKFKTTIGNVRNYFKQYCGVTSIHGFKYFGENRSTFEKIWWLFVFILCLCGCTIMIYKIYHKYETTPIIVTFATKETPIFKIPFPTVTICPQTKFERKKLNFTEIYNKQSEKELLTETETKFLKYSSLFCEKIDCDDKNCGFKFFTNNLLDDLDKLKPSFEETFQFCKFGKYENCSDLFVPVITDEGICYSFNILDRRHIFNDFVQSFKNYHQVDQDAKLWNMENGYLDESLGVYPRRALLSGATNGLILYLQTKSDNLDFLCRDVQGFKVVIHSPVRIPRLHQEYFRVPLDEDVVAAVQPLMITTSEAVKTFHVNKRDCYFPTERKLKYFRSYSQQNCILECLTNITLESCGCVDIFMPRENGTKICGVGSFECVEKAETISQLSEVYNKFDLGAQDIELRSCDCLPLCTDLSYNIEISQTRWDWKESIIRMKKLEDFDENLFHLSSLTIYFRFNHFITSERQELYGLNDFIANFGGLLGLFTGFSILSLMEIIYFLTVRICCNIRLTRHWTGN